MCEFCMRHGDGEKWYLEAANYAGDLNTDLKRREYIVDFVQGFSKGVPRNTALLKAIKASPSPIRKAFHSIAFPRQMANHFGQPVPIEECERIFDMATSIAQLPCVCRNAAGQPERGYCIAMTVTPADDALEEAFRGFESGPDVSPVQRLTREEATAILHRCEEEGLMHSVWTFGTPFIAAICNCNLASGCMAMKTTLELDYKTMWKGEYVASVSAEDCNGCRACEQRCPFSAITVDRGMRLAAVDTDACYGCGICRSACRKDAITLSPRQLSPTAEGW